MPVSAYADFGAMQVFVTMLLSGWVANGGNATDIVNICSTDKMYKYLGVVVVEAGIKGGFK